MVAFASDGANVMRGKKDSVLSRIKKICPFIYELHCVCHGAHLAAEEAAKDNVPKEVTFLINQISTWFNHSPKEAGILKRIQEELEEKPLVMMRKCNTRWL